MILLLIILLLVVLFLGDIAGISVCGFPKSDKECLEFIKKLRENDPYIIRGTRIITHYQIPGYISDSIKGTLFGCYIEGIGMVPRWYKSYSEIQKMYNELKEQ